MEVEFGLVVNPGCGKSASLLWKAIETAYLVPGCRVAIFRKTWPELQRNIWDELLKLPQRSLQCWWKVEFGILLGRFQSGSFA